MAAETNECLLCQVEIAKGEPSRPMPYIDAERVVHMRHVHDVCGLRDVVGGIGHLTDHKHWCLEMGDPDMGLSFYESAKLVRAWIDEHGIGSIRD